MMTRMQFLYDLLKKRVIFFPLKDFSSFGINISHFILTMAKEAKFPKKNKRTPLDVFLTYSRPFSKRNSSSSAVLNNFQIGRTHDTSSNLPESMFGTSLNRILPSRDISRMPAISSSSIISLKISLISSICHVFCDVDSGQ